MTCSFVFLLLESLLEVKSPEGSSDFVTNNRKLNIYQKAINALVVNIKSQNVLILALESYLFSFFISSKSLLSILFSKRIMFCLLASKLSSNRWICTLCDSWRAWIAERRRAISSIRSDIWKSRERKLLKLSVTEQSLLKFKTRNNLKIITNLELLVLNTWINVQPLSIWIFSQITFQHDRRKLINVLKTNLSNFFLFNV